MQMFFTAIVLPNNLNEKILSYKKWVQEKYGCRVGMKSPAHITLLPPFWTEPANEERLKQELQVVCNSFPSFVVETNNFSAFKPRTLFIAVKENERLNQLKKMTDNYFRGTNYGVKIDGRPFHPHITIATRDLHKKDFTDAWPHFENKKFEEGFEAAGISLLKHNGRTWDVVFTSLFSA